MRTQAYGVFMTAGRSALLSMQFVISYWSYYTGFLSTSLIGCLLFASAILVQCLNENVNGEMFETEDLVRNRKQTMGKKEGTSRKTEPSQKSESPLHKSSKSKKIGLEKPLVSDGEY